MAANRWTWLVLMAGFVGACAGPQDATAPAVRAGLLPTQALRQILAEIGAQALQFSADGILDRVDKGRDDE